MELPSPLETTHLGLQNREPRGDYSDRAQPYQLQMSHNSDRNATAGTTPAAEGAHATTDSSLAALTKLCNEFMENMTARFGKDSQENTLICGTLRDFRLRKLSKRETLSLVSGVIEGHHDLNEGLMGILYHGASSWAPGDFDLPPAPQFLQPAHEPQMRLPSISTLWQPNQQPAPVNSTVPGGYGGFESVEQPVRSGSFFTQSGYGEWQSPIRNMPSSPMVQTPTEGQQYVYGIEALDDRSSFHSSPAKDASKPFRPFQFNPYTNYMEMLPRCPGVDLEEATSPPSLSPGSIPQQRSNTEYDSFWADDRPDSLEAAQSSTVDCIPSLALENFTPSSSYNQRRAGSMMMVSPVHKHGTPRAPSPTHSVYEPSILGSPIIMPIGQPAIDMPPPPKKRSRKSLIVRLKVQMRDTVKEQHFSLAPPVVDQSPRISRAISPVAETKATRQKSEGGQFIHSICGRGFSGRAKVRKHHWGNKYDDVDTTTGCWAKHNKPDLSWDEHPSCKGSQQKSRSVQHAFAPATLVHEDHATLNLPEREVDAAASMDSEHPRGFHGGINPFQSYRMPVRSSFESLLTAVNEASRIEPAVPQGPIDSVAPYLDAQAAAVQPHDQYTMSWNLPPRQDGDYYHGRECLSPQTGPGPPPNMLPALQVPAYMVFSGYASSTVSPTESHPYMDASTAFTESFGNAKRQYEPDRPSHMPLQMKKHKF